MVDLRDENPEWVMWLLVFLGVFAAFVLTMASIALLGSLSAELGGPA